MEITDQPIPSKKLHQFHEILCATGGRYTCNPRFCGEVVRVSYIPGDHKAQSEAWRRCVEDIVEVRKDQWWRRALRRALYRLQLRIPPGATL